MDIVNNYMRPSSDIPHIVGNFITYSTEGSSKLNMETVSRWTVVLLHTRLFAFLSTWLDCRN